MGNPVGKLDADMTEAHLVGSRRVNVPGLAIAHTGSALGLLIGPGTIPPSRPALSGRSGLRRIRSFGGEGQGKI